MSNRTIIRDIEELFGQRGNSMYAGELVTQTEHALQCATQALESGAGDPLIAAALLHDIGHLLHDLGETCAANGVDDQHEQLGAEWLETFFCQDLSEPVKLHVSAKRYCCATRPDYLAQLSAASKLSLQLQGGPMSTQEVDAFREHPFFQQAVQLRAWDEAAKVRGLVTPPLSEFLEHVERSFHEEK